MNAARRSIGSAPRVAPVSDDWRTEQYRAQRIPTGRRWPTNSRGSRVLARSYHQRIERVYRFLAQTDALAKLLTEEGLITREEFMQKIFEERATYQKLFKPHASLDHICWLPWEVSYNQTEVARLCGRYPLVLSPRSRYFRARCGYARKLTLAGEISDAATAFVFHSVPATLVKRVSRVGVLEYLGCECVLLTSFIPSFLGAKPLRCQAISLESLQWGIHLYTKYRKVKDEDVGFKRQRKATQARWQKKERCGPRLFCPRRCIARRATLSVWIKVTKDGLHGSTYYHSRSVRLCP